MYPDEETKTSLKMSKFTERTIPEDLIIKEEIPLSRRSSPDSSTDLWGCPQCGIGNENETRLLEHLLHEHNIRVVPPQSPTKTRCPVCRHHVADLSHHFALEHGENQQDLRNSKQDTTPPNNQQGLPSGASVTRIIPIVLPSQPASHAQTLMNEDSEAHLLESVAPQSRQQIQQQQQREQQRESQEYHVPCKIQRTQREQHEFTDNYKSNGESTRSSTPSSMNNDNPVNLSIRRELQQPNNVEQDLASLETNSSDSGSLYNIGGQALVNGRKRRKQTHVPDTNKDDRYWARRLKNNEAAKKSRDMRIKREKVIFEENMRLEKMAKDLQAENESYMTENKELHLKMGIILDENVRLKAMLRHYEERDYDERN